MPSAGKTSLSKQIADQVADKEKVPVLFFTYEQGAVLMPGALVSRVGEPPLAETR